MRQRIKRRGSKGHEPAPLYPTFLTAFGFDDACLLRQRAQRRLWPFADPSASSTTTRTVPPWQALSEGEGAEGVRLGGIGSSIAIAKPQRHV
jgi:hypothetical protein